MLHPSLRYPYRIPTRPTLPARILRAVWRWL